MIYTLGESLMDIISTHDGKTIANPGGSLLNVSVSLARAGKNVSLISEMGDDETGVQLVDFLTRNGINTDLVTVYEDCNTSKAIATLDENSKPGYRFQKAYPADRRLAESPAFTESDVLILGSMYSRDPEIEYYLVKFLDAAKRGGALIVYDPNVRHNHQLKLETSKDLLLKNFKFADIIKGSDEDFYNIFQLTAPTKVNDALMKINSSALIFMTLGAKGSEAFYKDMKSKFVPEKIKTLSTIGAGDAFTAGIVNSLVDQKLIGDLKNVSKEQIKKLMIEGSRFASLVCQSMDNYISAQN